MAWNFVVQLIVSMAVTYLAGKIFKEDPEAKAPDKQYFNPEQLPTINEGDVIPVVFGTQKLARPNIIYYGGFTTDGAGAAGYYYYLTLDLAFCHGPVDVLQKVYWGDFPVTTGYGTSFAVSGSNVTISGSYTLPLTRGSETSRGFCLWSTDLFGGSKREGGTGGGGDLIWGDPSASLTPTYPGVEDPIPSHYGIFRLILPSWYLGTQPQPKSVAVEVSRYPKLLTSSDYYSNINDDANPIECIYEILTNTTWGLSMPTSSVDSANWTTAAQTVKSDGLGCSFALTSQDEADSVINDLMNMVDGIIYSDPTTGKLKIKLIREDYTVATLPTFDETNIVSFECSVPWYSETANEVCIQFVDRAADYRDRTARSQDIANQVIQGQTVSESKRFRGVSRAVVAQFLSARELRVASTPLMRCNFRTTRGAWDLKPGDPFKVSWAESGVSAKVMRLTKISYGTLEDGIIDIEAIEDAFSVTSGIYSYPGDPTGGTLGVPGAVTPVLIAPMPHEIRPDSTGDFLIVMGKKGINTAGIRLWLQNDYPSDPLVDTGKVWPGTCTALAQTTVSTESDLVDIVPAGLDIDIQSGTFPFGTEGAYSPEYMATGATLFCRLPASSGSSTDVEWLQFSSVQKIADNQYRLMGVNRLMSYSNEPKSITAGSTKFFFPVFNSIFNVSNTMYAHLGPYIAQSIDHTVKLQGYNALQSKALSGITEYAITKTIDPLTPIRPANIRFYSPVEGYEFYPSTCTGGTFWVFGLHRNKLETIVYRQDQQQITVDPNYYHDFEVRCSNDGYSAVIASHVDFHVTGPNIGFDATINTTNWPIGDYIKIKVKTYYLEDTTKHYGPEIELGPIRRVLI